MAARRMLSLPRLRVAALSLGRPPVTASFRPGLRVAASSSARLAAVAVALAAAAPARAQRVLPATQPAVEAAEPALAQVEEAAVRRAAGPLSEELSRISRARSAHWAPVVRAQFGIRDDGRTRRGQVRLAPLVEDDLGESRAWAVVATWDLAQIVYARDEAQLALAHVHLARVRQQAVDDAIRLYEERWRLRAALRFLPRAASRARVDALLALLRATAGLDGLTSGLYAAQLAQVEAEVSALEALLEPGSVPAPAPGAPSGARMPQRFRRAQDPAFAPALDDPPPQERADLSAAAAIAPPAPQPAAGLPPSASPAEEIQ